MRAADFSPALRHAIERAREAGLTESASELEGRAFAAYTTSSEFLGEVGEAILQFRAREGARVPADVAALLDECLSEVGKVWPQYTPGPLAANARSRSRHWVWRALPVAALAIAATGLAACVAYLAARTAGPGSPLHTWAAFAVLRILVAPLFALVFFLSGLLAPTRSPRLALLVATGIEAAVFVYIVFTWFHPLRLH